VIAFLEDPKADGNLRAGEELAGKAQGKEAVLLVQRAAKAEGAGGKLRVERR